MSNEFEYVNLDCLSEDQFVSLDGEYNPVDLDITPDPDFVLEDMPEYVLDEIVEYEADLSQIREANCLRNAIKVINNAKFAKSLEADKGNIAGLSVVFSVASWRNISKKTGTRYLNEVVDAIKKHCSESVHDAFKEAFLYLDTFSKSSPVKGCVEVKKTLTGLKCFIPKGKALALKGFDIMRIPYDINVTLNRWTLSEQTANVLNRVVIHGLHSLSDHTEESNYSESLIWGSELLAKLVLIVNSKINLDTLYRNPSYELVLKIDEKGFLAPVQFPALTLPSTYMVTGAVSPSQASAGYIATLTNVKHLVEYRDDLILTAGSVNKAVARQEKLVSTTHSGWLVS